MPELHALNIVIAVAAAAAFCVFDSWTVVVGPPRCCSPTDPSTVLKLQNPSHGVPEPHKIRRSPDLAALEFQQGRSGVTIAGWVERPGIFDRLWSWKIQDVRMLVLLKVKACLANSFGSRPDKTRKMLIGTNQQSLCPNARATNSVADILCNGTGSNLAKSEFTRCNFPATFLGGLN